MDGIGITVEADKIQNLHNEAEKYNQYIDEILETYKNPQMYTKLQISGIIPEVA